MERQPVRVLYVNGGTMDRGGISSYMMNYFRHIDRNLIHIDFVVHGDGGIYDDEIMKLKGNVFHVPTKKQSYFGNRNQIRKIILNGNYDIIHSHMDGMNGKILKWAKELGVKIRISHSHNTAYLTTNKIKLIYHEYMRKEIPKYATHLFACSRQAGEWLYGGRKFQVIPNAIDTNKFFFNAGKRAELRSKLGLGDNYVIGHIGRFDINQKNQLFLLEVFAKLLKIKSDAQLILIGDGLDRELVEDKINELELNKNVILLGEKDNVNDWLNVFDIFCFPSNFEGLGVVMIEAQANGLACVCSDKVPNEVNISGNVKFLGLNDGINDWVDNLLEDFGRDENATKKLTISGYDINAAANKLQHLYLEMKHRINTEKREEEIK